jgi:hypothetical protein
MIVVGKKKTCQWVLFAEEKNHTQKGLKEVYKFKLQQILSVSGKIGSWSLKIGS